MPAKQVRFAYANTYHPHGHPHPQLPPGLSYSSDTLPSSSGPLTPPHAAHPLPYGPHYPPIPFHKHPSRYPAPACFLHHYLAPDAIHWIMQDHPSTAIRGRHYISSTSAFHKPATTPGLPYIHIFIRYSSSRSPWTCRVHASNRQFVTVFDVLEALYRCLRVNITQDEFHILSDKDKRRATRAYEDRYRRIRDPIEHEQAKRGGMKRIDFMERKRFAGLRDGHHQPHEFDLLVT